MAEFASGIYSFTSLDLGAGAHLTDNGDGVLVHIRGAGGLRADVSGGAEFTLTAYPGNTWMNIVLYVPDGDVYSNYVLVHVHVPGVPSPVARLEPKDPKPERFLDRLEGVGDPERKRKVIGATFIDVFEEKARALGEFDFLAQGTLYPDVIESASVLGPAVVIKSHHNVGGLPERMNFKLVEPLRDLFKDEVRRVGHDLGLDREFVVRQPFPGPGLAVRVIGELTRPRLDLLRLADKIVAEEVRRAGWYERLWQSFAVLLPVQSVGVMGDARTYEYTIAIRAVESLDGMTADWARLPHEILAAISSRIVNEVRGINRVVYDISSKPPSTIEWE